LRFPDLVKQQEKPFKVAVNGVVDGLQIFIKHGNSVNLFLMPHNFGNIPYLFERISFIGKQSRRFSRDLFFA
jgi:hypothetical protein